MTRKIQSLEHKLELYKNAYMELKARNYLENKLAECPCACKVPNDEYAERTWLFNRKRNRNLEKAEHITPKEFRRRQFRETAGENTYRKMCDGYLIVDSDLSSSEDEEEDDEEDE